MRSAVRRLLCLGAVLGVGLLAACERAEQEIPSPGDGQPSAAMTGFLDTTRWTAWPGEGFKMRIPSGGADSILNASTGQPPGHTLAWQPDSTLRPFRFSVEYLPRPRVPLARYVDSIRVAYNKLLDPESTPSDPAGPTTIAGQTALDLSPWCRTCVRHEVYVPLGTRLVVFRFSYDDPTPVISELQRMLYQGILATIQLNLDIAT